MPLALSLGEIMTYTAALIVERIFELQNIFFIRLGHRFSNLFRPSSALRTKRFPHVSPSLTRRTWKSAMNELITRTKLTMNYMMMFGFRCGKAQKA